MQSDNYCLLMNIRISNIQALKFTLFLSSSCNILILAVCKLSGMQWGRFVISPWNLSKLRGEFRSCRNFFSFLQRFQPQIFMTEQMLAWDAQPPRYCKSRPPSHLEKPYIYISINIFIYNIYLYINILKYIGYIWKYIKIYIKYIHEYTKYIWKIWIYIKKHVCLWACFSLCPRAQYSFSGNLSIFSLCALLRL